MLSAVVRLFNVAEAIPRIAPVVQRDNNFAEFIQVRHQIDHFDEDAIDGPEYVLRD